MDSKIEVIIENIQQRRFVPQGISLLELAKEYSEELKLQEGRYSPLPILGALVNNITRPLQYRVYNPKSIRFFTIKHRQGWRTYQNSLCFMLYKAVHDCYPGSSLHIDHSMTNGFFCRIDHPEWEQDGVRPTPLEVVKTVRGRMLELQQADLPFESRTMLLTDAIELMRTQHIPETVRLFEGLSQIYIDVQFLDGLAHKMSSPLAPSTGCLQSWNFRTFADGYLLECADPEHPEKLGLYQEMPKLFSIYQEHHRWASLLHVPTVSDLNRLVADHGANHLIHVAEALHEKKYAEIADMIYQRRDTVKMVLLAGPSSSGKTTSCRRLSVQLSVLGFDVRQLSLDDYFVCRARTPKLPNGEYDFENIEALDIPLLNEHLTRLFQGEEVAIPTFDFIKGDPYFSGKTLRLGPNSILLVEGIHALNPRLTAQIADEVKFRVYVSALTQIAIDDQNIIHCSDNRLIRRMVRDNNFRGWDAYNTLHRWEEVQRGEQLHIFPYQEQADVMFNSALLYELGVLKVYAEPLLKKVPENCQEYAEAHRLLNFIELIAPIGSGTIPPNSIMREFLGGSSFEY
ncbi:MAG: uridine kinase [bacterium P3]|nr:MAG: uridine kinase [bacterium P3]KWW40442.1 MAG: uridine kinase [bacterium F083]